ncbi:hypothetical protein DCS_00899 [Drechmeria coniospora]|uniref:Regulator of G protein signaling superfamily n=1 Tax=Drechmeria coniospora TaxID=98403 RepID=A0A151GRN0_DRECN|nr:hypothetical protein DCS_00899 [Drechmeria coniospora]KYK59765.1 hypothetical protein DCS_00899 [Drechmeria coniospora]ODA78568.1 hypothetical protein RJ55_05950 [Drechmeria coniospora]
MGRLLSLAYTRPKRVRLVQSSDSPAHVESDGSLRSGQSGSSAGIPDSLSFDNIMGSGTCPVGRVPSSPLCRDDPASAILPMTIRDFMNYLLYVEHAAENLQFCLWYRDYTTRFNEALASEISLAPEWSQAMEEDAVTKIRKEMAEKLRPEPEAAEIFQGTDFEKKQPDTLVTSALHTSPQTSHDGGADDGSEHTAAHSRPSETASAFKSRAADMFTSAGVKQPFTIQPFREEINRVITTYILEGAPRQLNLSSWEQKVTARALSYTTHPSALRSLHKSVEASLRHQAHPNFVRWSICNGNPARVTFARALGVGLIAAGIALGIVLTLSKLGRGYRALAAIPLVLGISTLVAAYKGMCVVLHGMHHRHVRPWELFAHKDGEELGKNSFDSFGSKISYEDEPWVVRYEKRNIIRKIFDREVWIEEPALRQIQDTIFVQALLASLLLGGIVTAIFVAVPGGDLF